MPTITETITARFEFKCHQEGNTLVLDSVEEDGRPLVLSELSTEVTDFLALELIDGKFILAPGVVNSLDELYSNPVILVLERGDRPRFCFNFTRTERKPQPLEPGTPAIAGLADLCDYFGAETPSGLNHRIYKSTDAGASISVQLPDGTWFHNGRNWDVLSVDTPIAGFTIQTIVEGSDITVDSDRFLVPVAKAEMVEWIDFMEKKAAKIWDAANLDHYRIKEDSDYLGVVIFQSSELEGVELENVDEDDWDVDLVELKKLIFEAYFAYTQFEEFSHEIPFTVGDRSLVLKRYDAERDAAEY